MMLARPELEPDDSDLARCASGGDRQAFSALVARRYDFIFRLAWRWTGRREDAEDIAQEACIRLGRAIQGFRGEGAFTTWLYALTLNVARDHGRKSSRMARQAEAYAAEARVDQAGEACVCEAERLWAAVRLLPGKQREAVTLVHGEGLTHGKAAEAMGVAEATVSWHIHEARKRLKVLMTEARED